MCETLSRKHNLYFFLIILESNPKKQERLIILPLLPSSPCHKHNILLPSVASGFWLRQTWVFLPVLLYFVFFLVHSFFFYFHVPCLFHLACRLSLHKANE